jgi:ABC-type lipoprotein release transport system permease subunit
MSVMKRIKNPDEVTGEVERTKNVTAYAKRIKAFCLAAANENSSGGLILAVEPDKERTVSRMHRTVREGEYLRSGRDDEVVIGYVLADNLGIGIGDKIAIITGAADGSMGAEKYRVVGLADPGISTLNNSLILMTLPAAQEILSYGEAVNEIVIMTDDVGHTAGITESLRESVDTETYEVLPWYEIAPEMKQMIELDWGGFVVMIVVFVAVAALSVANTMVMAVTERTREFGIMQALGLKSGQLALLIIVESFLISMIAITAGFILAGICIIINSYWGFDMSVFMEQESLADWGMANTVMFPKWRWHGLLTSFLTIFVPAMLASLYPAWRVGRMTLRMALRG